MGWGAGRGAGKQRRMMPGRRGGVDSDRPGTVALRGGDRRADAVVARPVGRCETAGRSRLAASRLHRPLLRDSCNERIADAILRHRHVLDRSMNDAPARQTAEVAVRAGSFSAQRVDVTPAGLLAIGGLVGCILLSTAALVWTATSGRRRRSLPAR